MRVNIRELNAMHITLASFTENKKPYKRLYYK